MLSGLLATVAAASIVSVAVAASAASIASVAASVAASAKQVVYRHAAQHTEHNIPLQHMYRSSSACSGKDCMLIAH